MAGARQVIFSLVVQAAPPVHQGAETAYRFARAALASGHRVRRVFFYADGVHAGNALLMPWQDAIDISSRWRLLADREGIDLVVCIGTAARRGLIDETEAKRNDKSAFNLGAGFALSGLGQLVGAALESDRLITFGC